MSRAAATTAAPKKVNKPPVAVSVPNPLLEVLDITPHPRGFKNAAYKAPLRRNKNLKAILSDATNADPNRLNPTTKLLQPTYQNIESAPSLRRGNKWCDITGLPSRYTDPKTKLRFRDGEVYQVLRNLGAGGAERYLEVRGANVILK